VKLTEEQIHLLVVHLNNLFSEDNYDAQGFLRTIPTDDLEDLWQLRSELYNSMEDRQ